MSQKKGFTIKAWNLCIPYTLSASEKVWWEKWLKEKKKATGISIRLMEHLDLVNMLRTSDAVGLCSEFNLTDKTQLIMEERQIAALPVEISRQYDRSLFISSY